ncbi:dihydrofolate reductase family protein [Streptomyces indicus]|uniref:Dihydrofolate reductase n=1 Tax=Streptomyces indicus TaxID=417292 RepID=A0A1G8X8C3_9ACTN|nr:dihydrofolate reductase family protein [Streptomyces indicus]SDJ86753.1 Dihydrofolate reductase [Streptomyces indicus]
MSKLRVHVTVSLDGFMCGQDQRLDAPFGDGVDGLMDWQFGAMKDRADGKAGPDVEALDRAEDNLGATIMGRNMFGPVRGPWQDESWTGWWGENPPYHHDVFVHTHHVRPDLPMSGGTTFHFTDEAPEKVLDRAFAAAGGRDVRLGGGASTIRQYLRAGLVDVMELAVAPVLVGGGERLLDRIGEPLDGLRVTGMESSAAATHVRLVRR